MNEKNRKSCSIYLAKFFVPIECTVQQNGLLLLQKTNKINTKRKKRQIKQKKAAKIVHFICFVAQATHWVGYKKFVYSKNDLKM